MKIKLIAVVAGIILLNSCASLVPIVTGQPVPTTPVKRVDSPNAPAFDVATQDVLRAESTPGQTWGLYNAGRVTEQIGEIAGNSSK